MLRVSDETREKILRIGREEFDGASADETVRCLIDERWQANAVAAVRRYRAKNRSPIEPGEVWFVDSGFPRTVDLLRPAYQALSHRFDRR